MVKTMFPLWLLHVTTLLTFVACAMAALRCGDCGRTQVPYPLSTGPNCGNQAYKLRCNAGTLWLDGLNGSSYAITSANPATQRLIIRPATIAANTCVSSDFHSEGIQLDQNLPFNITSSNTIVLLNCTDALFHLQVPFNCSTNCLCHAYVQNTPAAAACVHAPICCSLRTGGSQNSYIIRVHSGGCSAYQSFVNLDPSLPVAKWPEPGVEIEWELPQEPTCSLPADCRDLPNSKCLLDPASVGRRRCFCNAGRLWDPVTGLCQKCGHKRGCKVWKSKMPVIGGSVGAIVFLVVGITLAHRLHRRVKKEARRSVAKEREEMLNANNSGKSAKIFTGKELKKATNNFSKDNLLGSGGFGDVFKATLDDGTVTAVKRAKPGNTKAAVQVLNEVRILCQVNHRSLVRLLGCCIDLDHPLLVYEYVTNATLFHHLHGRGASNIWTPLPWHRRLCIAHQTAQGLAYLHSSAQPPIYHRDVKSSNILLDGNLDAKVSDFGLSRLVERGEAERGHVSTCAQGTLGYLDPEYCLNLQLTDKSDVYSFGVVLLELLTSKRAIDFNREEENVNLVVYVKRLMAEERLMEAVDPWLKKGASKVELETMEALGFLAGACLDERRQNRPSMKEVAEEIECIISIVSADISKT